MERRPPEITIVDPNNPVGTTDLIHSDPAPWRPSRRQLRVGAVVVVLLLLAGAVRWGVQTVLDRRADRAAVAEVKLVTDPGDVQFTGADMTPFPLMNRGPRSVQLVSVQVLGDGDPLVRDTAELKPGVPYFGAVPEGTTCPHDLLFHAPDHVRVVVRTNRGGAATRTLRIPGDFAQQYALSERIRCRFLPLFDTLESMITTARPTAGGATFTMQLLNRSRIPVDVVGWRTFPGMTTTARRVTVPPDRRPVVVQVRIRITSCAAWSRSQLADGVDNTGDASGADGGLVQVELRRVDATGVIILSTWGYRDHADPMATVAKALQGMCPSYTTVL